MATSRARKDDSHALEDLRDLIAKALADSTAHRQRPMQARSRQRIAEIQKAAIAVFARDGIAAARMADVAEKASMPVSSIYEHFPSKDDLAQSTLTAGLSDFFSELLNRSPELSSAREYLELFLRLTVEIPWQDPDWARVYHLEVWPSASASEGRVRQALVSYRDILLEILLQGGARGEWPAQPDPYQTALILTGSLHQFMISWFLYKEPANPRKAAISLVKKLIRILEIG